MTDLSAVKPGDTVVLFDPHPLHRFRIAYSRVKVTRVTDTQIVIENGRRFVRTHLWAKSTIGTEKGNGAGSIDIGPMAEQRVLDIDRYVRERELRDKLAAMGAPSDQRGIQDAREVLDRAEALLREAGEWKDEP
jgi:hypothetical protein